MCFGDRTCIVCIWLTSSDLPLVLFRGVQRDSYSTFGANSFQKFCLRTCLSSDDKLAVYCVFDFEIFGAADTWEILWWPENVDTPERKISGSGFDKRVPTIRLYLSTVRHLTRATHG